MTSFERGVLLRDPILQQKECAQPILSARPDSFNARDLVPDARAQVIETGALKLCECRLPFYGFIVESSHTLLKIFDPSLERSQHISRLSQMAYPDRIEVAEFNCAGGRLETGKRLCRLFLNGKVSSFELVLQRLVCGIDQLAAFRGP
jgi:hypothetical protein